MVSNEVRQSADTAIFEWLGGIRVDYGTAFAADYVSSPKNLSNWPILRVGAPPHRAFADPRVFMKAQGFFNAPDYARIDDIKEANVNRLAAMPFVSIQSGDSSPVTDMHRTPIKMRTLFSDGMDWLQVRYPTPYEIPYTIELFAKSLFTIAYLDQWVLSQFTPVGAGVNERLLSITYPAPYGSMFAAFTFEGLANNDDVEVSGYGGRSLRRTLTGRLRVLNVVLNPVRVPMVSKITLSVHGTERAAPELGDYGAQFDEIDLTPLIVYEARPLSGMTTHRRTTATRRDVTSSQIQTYTLDDPAEVVVTPSVPVPNDSHFFGLVGVKWRTADGDPEGSVFVDVGYYRPATDETFVLAQTHELAYAEDGAECLFTTFPGSSLLETAVRIRSANPIHASVTQYKIGLVSVTNLVPSQSRSFNPYATPTNLSVTLSAIGTYVARAFVTVASLDVTVSLYRDAGATVLLKQQTFTENGEFIHVFEVTEPTTVVLRMVGTGSDATASFASIVVGGTSPVTRFDG